MLRYLSRTFWTNRTAPEWHDTSVLHRFWRFHCTRYGRRNSWELWCTAHRYVCVTDRNSDLWSRMFKCIYNAWLELHNIHTLCSLDLERSLRVRNSHISFRNLVQNNCSGTVFWTESSYSDTDSTCPEPLFRVTRLLFCLSRTFWTGIRV
jgi:hypothetical protein